MLERRGDRRLPGEVHNDSVGRGVCIWLTGMGGAGKSTVAGQVAEMIEARGRTVTILDVVPEIDKAPGERNSSGKLRRKAFVAGLIADHGGVAICVTISSRREDRDVARQIVGEGRFLEVFVDAPPDVARRRRERRGRRVPLVKRVRRSGLELARRLGVARGRGFEVPESPDLVLDPVNEPPDEGARRIRDLLEHRGFVRSSDDALD